MRLGCLALAAMGIAACGDTHLCTAIGCDSRLELVVMPPLTEPGSYRIELQRDDGTAVCTATLGASLVIDEGCALFLEPSVPSVVDIARVTLPLAPASVTLRVERDGAQVLEKSITPDYAIERPNGPLCEPECRTASISVER